MEAVTGIQFAAIYVDDYARALDFYQKHFNYQIKYVMSESASWGMAGRAGIYLEGGNASTMIEPKAVRAAVVFSVNSAPKFFEQLQQDGVPVLQSEPQDMGGGQFWFQFRDPAGNILEIVGGQ